MVTQRTLTPLCECSILSASVAHGRRRKAPFESMRRLWAVQNKDGNMRQNKNLNVAQFGSAPDLGSGGCRFKSCHSD